MRSAPKLMCASPDDVFESSSRLNAMQMKEAWAVLGLPSNATPLQVKVAYKRKALENHPDRFPPQVKLEAEARFKHISEAYTCLKNGPQPTYGHGGRSHYSSYSGSSSWVSRGRRVNTYAASMPFALLIAGTLALGFSRAASIRLRADTRVGWKITLQGRRVGALKGAIFQHKPALSSANSKAYQKQQKESPAGNPFLP